MRLGRRLAAGNLRALKTTSAPDASLDPVGTDALPNAEPAFLKHPAKRRFDIAGFWRQAVADQALRWPLFAPVALMLGAGVYMTLPVEPDWAPLIAATLIGLALWRALIGRGAGRASLLCLMLACAGGGALAGKIRTVAMAAPVLVREIGPVRVEGVVEEIDAGQSSRRLRIAVRAIEGLPQALTPRFVRVAHKGEIRVGPGRAVTCNAILSPPPAPVVPGDYAFHRDAYFQQLGGVGFALGECQPLATPPPATLVERGMRWIGALRRAIAEHVNETAGQAGGGMSAAMISGDRSFIEPEDAEALRASGLAHLISISGVHMVLAGGIFFFIVRYTWPLIEPLALRVPAVKAGALFAIIACSLYFGISGGEVATQRSWIMALIAFGAKLFDRPAISLRSLAVALVVVVLIQPESVVTPGFQMSFAASAALIALYEVWPKLDRPSQPGVIARVAAWFVGATSTSIVASFATMPFALYHFDRAAVFSVLANLAATPVISFITTPAAAAAALAAPFGLEAPFFWVMGQSVGWVVEIAHRSAELAPDENLHGLPVAGIVWASIAILIAIVMARHGRLLALVPAIFAVAAWTSAPTPVAYVARDGAVFVKAGEQWLEMTDWRSENGLDPLAIKGAKAKSPCPGKGQPCRIEQPYGAYEIVDADSGAMPAPFALPPTSPLSGQRSGLRGEGGKPARPPKRLACPSPVRLEFKAADGSAPLRIDPCEIAKQGGAVLETTSPGRRLRIAPPDTGRPWSPHTEV